MLERALELARAGRAQAESELFELISIPSVSALSAHRGDCRRAAAWLADRLRGRGMEARVLDVLEGGHPVVVAEWLGRPGAPTLTVYGHYDVQPPDPVREWSSPPFQPTVRDGFVYARGADDNKGQHMCTVRAAGYALAAGGPPVNLRLLIEGEEEISGPSLATYVRSDARRLATDYLIMLDGGFTAPGRPNLVTGLRGLLYVEIDVSGAPADLHSGIFGGVAPNALNSMAHVLSALKRPDGLVTIPGFYDDVLEPTPEERESWMRLPITEETLKREMGVSALEGEPERTPTERRWSRPTLDVHGIVGGFVEEGVKTVIPARATAKVSMRLVPDQDPARILASLREYLPTLATPGSRVTVRDKSQDRAVRVDSGHPGIAAARRAFLAAFGAEPLLTREGGSLPVASVLQEALRPHMVISGFGLPGDGLHSPNERYSLDQYHRGTEMVLHFMDELGRL